jgi:rubrerythrin
MNEDARNSVIHAIEQVMMKERYVVKDYQRRADEEADSAAKQIFLEVVQLRQKQFAELEQRLTQLKSQTQITDEINSIFW